jgi:hypothetical protein
MALMPHLLRGVIDVRVKRAKPCIRSREQLHWERVVGRSMHRCGNTERTLLGRENSLARDRATDVRQ